MRRYGVLGVIRLAAAVAALVWAAGGPSYAGDCFWQHDPNTAGDWADPNNWTPSAPGSFDTALIDNGGTAGILGGNVTVWSVIAGDSFRGSVLQSGGSSAVAYLDLGHSAGGTGTYGLSGGTLQLDIGTMVGGNGRGSFAQSGGTHGVRSLLALGDSPGAVGTYELSGGSLGSQNDEIVGWSGRGVFVQSGGTSAVRYDLFLGFEAGGTGTYDLSGGSLGSYNETVGVTGTGSFAQSGGTNAVRCELFLGHRPGGTGIYDLSGGSLGARSEAVGSFGTGTFTQSAGINALRGTLYVGCDGVGIYRLTGGSLTAAGAIMLASPSGGTAVVNVSRGAYVEAGGLTVHGGTAHATTVGLELDANMHSVIHTTGTSTLGGTMDVQAVGGFRPREGDAFSVIASSDPNGVHFVNNFTTFTSNITYGLPAGSDAFGGAPDGADYKVVFLGYTHGDANGNHKVDGGDLALMGGAWMKTGQTWATGNFNGDPNGIVDGGDLALMAGNWMWALPSPSPPGAPLPEPTVTILLGAGLALIAARRRNRHGVLGRIRRPEALTAGGFGDTL